MPIQDLITTTGTAPMSVALEPAHNALNSLVLLVKAEETSGLGEWVARTASALSLDEKRKHKLVFIGLHHAIVPHQSWSSFPAYLDYVAACDPIALRDKMMDTYARIPLLTDAGDENCFQAPVPATESVINSALSSAENYVAFLRTRFKAEAIDQELEAQAYTYVVNPPAMQEVIVSHLRMMWDQYLAAEWARVEPMLQDAVRAFQQVDLNRMGRLAAAEQVLDRELEQDHWGKWLDQFERVVFVPSAHVGPYVGKFHTHHTIWILFGARLPQGSALRVPELSRAEVLVRLDALADDTRLRILQFVVEEGESRSQEIMAHLSLSQPATSRHLQQLCAAGYLTERRCDGAKCYQFNPHRLKDTLQAISAFLLKKGTPPKKE
jgi:DNA-binding transcriptional ArsR family regulator